jgi:hypothetical protein
VVADRQAEVAHIVEAVVEAVVAVEDRLVEAVEEDNYFSIYV